MRVVCDNCGATYKIPESKLTREVNKATCRKCGHGIIIRKPGSGGLSVSSVAPAEDGESTQITSQDELEARARAQAMPSGFTPAFGGAPGLPQMSDEVVPPIAPGLPPMSDEVVPPTVVDRPEPPEQTVPRNHQAGGLLLGSPSTPMQRPSYSPDPLAPPLAPTTAPRSAAPAPSPPRAQPAAPVLAKPPPGVQAHDPAGDMAVVMIACFGAILGVGVLATSGGNPVQNVIGLAIALISTLGALLVIVTSDRGRKPARIFLSSILALLFGGCASFSFGVVDFADQIAEAFQLGGYEGGVQTPPVVAASSEKAGKGEEAEAPATEPDGALAELSQADSGAGREEPVPEPKEEPARASGSSSSGATTSGSSSSTSGASTSGSTASKSSGSTSSSGSSSKSSGSTTGGSTSGSSSKSSGSSSKSSGSTSSTAPAAAAAEGVPVTVLDTMLRYNQGVKRCFGVYRQETGALPTGRITVKLTIAPSGSATAASIDGGQYVGTSLDSCLSSAIKEIAFPPWDGSSAKTYYYPFNMN